jgi:transcriptional regulator with PAS, ATPase and Fis domain
MDATGTLSQSDDSGRRGTAGVPSTCLFRVMEGGDPAAAPSRHRLDRVRTVVLGRGDRAATRDGEQLTLSIPDGWISTHHATLSLVSHRCVLEDAGSRNGTRLNGQPVRRAVLTDGDMFEIGRTIFVFREGLTLDANEPDDVAADQLAAPRPELATLVPALRRHFAQLARAAASTESIVIRGETGTGKEVVARAIHALSGRRGPFVAVNCGALPETLVESELFGVRKGAFSGATDRVGLVRSSEGGTLFLDEVADLRAPSQAALLRVLQEREVLPLGATRPQPVDLRVVCATHRNLEAMVDSGEFRADLYARLSGFTVQLVALADRREDFGLLVRTLLERRKLTGVMLTSEALRALFDHDWPGHIRELDKVIGSAVALAGDRPIALEHLPSGFGLAQPATEALGRRDAQIREQLESLLREHRGNIAAVAREMGKGRQQIHRWLQRFGLDIKRFRD